MAIYLNLTNNRYKGYIEFSSTNTFDEFDSSNVKSVLVKRKINGIPGGWITIFTKSIAIDTDLVFNEKDIYARSGETYLYEMEYYDENNNLLTTISNTVESVCDCIVICDSEDCYFTPLNTGSIDVNRIKPYTMNTPYNATKPSYYCNSTINYEEGSCTGVFLDIEGTDNDFNFVTKNNYKYRNSFKNWLTNGKAKLLKNIYGEVWVIAIKTDTISDKGMMSNGQVEGARTISFDWFEVGDANSEEEMYELGLSDIESSYWSGV